MNELITSIKKEFSPIWLLNDRGHREEHFDDVLKTGLHINEALNLGFDEKLIVLVAYFHDMFAWSRNNHQLMSAHWVRTTDHKFFASLSEEERELVALACEEHRASYRGEYSHLFCELMASADRGFPKLDMTDRIQRSVIFRIDRVGMSEEEAYIDSIKHVIEKYGRGGYARLPAMYMKAFESEIQQFYDEVDRLSLTIKEGV